MTKIFFATGNKGKQGEISRLADTYGDAVTVTFPDASNKKMVEETGKTFEQNALLKAEAYAEQLNDEAIVVGDDTGLIIPALNNEPGVYTRRWAGYEMSDRELIDYCLEKMRDLTGDERRAEFQTVLVALFPDGTTKTYRGRLPGWIVEEPKSDEIHEGFPFWSLFWVDELDLLLGDVHSLTSAEREGFLTHRESAFVQLFDEVSG